MKLIFCRFLATGDSFRTIATNYRLGHSTVQSIVIQVCEAIIENLMSLTMPKPTADQWKKIVEEFWDIWNFPNCIGALDGKHVVIQAPANNGSQFFNYKKTFSIVLLALVDAHYRFIAVDIGGYGRNSDGGLFANSKLAKALEKNKLDVPKDNALPNTQNIMPYVIVGDEAFPLKKYLLRPYPGSQIQGDRSKRIFNYRLSRARRVSENVFGILSQKFQLFNRRLKLKPENADKIILTICILHNYFRDYNINVQDHAHNQNSDTGLQNLPRQGGSAINTAFIVRDAFKEFFITEHGRVEWQDTIN
ncbi:protein ALP1-like [Formica exsecta]|uniref:protein ALP1-like n=1 Tax=Formica exsecta TaxID=72781 RepID=UPI0011423E14|nr:protein ALP1-like [Formica exsecta]